MINNVGGTDRLLRLAIGTILIFVGIAGYAGYVTVAIGPISQALGAIILLLIGIILFVTGFIQKCPINQAAGIDTTR